jgi:hypothetical protein
MKHQKLSALGVESAIDLCALDPNPPPLSFARDLKLPPHSAAPIAYQSPTLDTHTYWQGPTP